MRQRRGVALRRAVSCALGAVLAIAVATPAFADTVPDAPAQPSVTGGVARVTVSFTAPFDGGNPITSYTASCNDGGAPATMSGPGSPIIVAGLDDGQAYTCNVTATNGIGTSMPSPDSAPANTATAPDAPAKPSVDAGDAQITVTFVAPANGGSAITGYTATCTDGTTPVTMSGPASPIAVTDLTNGNSYTCSVTATNAVGPSPPSPSSTSVEPMGAPDPPAKPVLTLANHAIVVAFTPPAANGGTIDLYSALCTSTNGGVSGNASRSASPIKVTGLTDRKSYRCRVDATSNIGTSAPSPYSSSVVVAGVPDAPPAPVIARGNHQIVVRFKAPVNNGSAVIGYTVTCASSNHGVRGFQVGVHSPITVTGLTDGKTYTCSARATNAIGSGASSPASAAVVVGVPPAAPTVSTVLPGNAPGPNGPLRVSFKPGPDNGTPISSYRATCRRLFDGAATAKVGTFSPITVGGLISGRSYSCSVVAISASGTSGPSNPITATVGTPGMITNITYVRHAHGLTFTYSQPARNGQVILHYHAICKSTNGGLSISQYASSGGPFTVNGMTPGKTYTCVLTAGNLRGYGPPAKVGPLTLPYF